MQIYINEFTHEYITEEYMSKHAGTISKTDIFEIMCIYHVIEEGVYEKYVIREYPETGGKDIGKRIVSPEIGEWVMIDQSTGERLNYEIPLDTSGWDKSKPFVDILTISYWHEYTPAEIAEMEVESEKAQKFQQTIEALPDRVEDLEIGIDYSYDAIVELGDVVADHDITLDDIMDAIAELGQIVEANNG